MTAGSRVVVRQRVRWSDLDRARIVYFERFLAWVEAAEAEFFRARGFTYDAFEGVHEIFLARVHLAMDFRRPARLDDELSCWAELQKLGRSSLHFAFPIEREGERIVDVKLILACLDRTTLKPKRIPAEIASALEGD
jgi:YbgC/YbaW family acyl-CoA thioester hydrolase